MSPGHFHILVKHWNKNLHTLLILLTRMQLRNGGKFRFFAELRKKTREKFLLLSSAIGLFTGFCLCCILGRFKDDLASFFGCFIEKRYSCRPLCLFCGNNSFGRGRFRSSFVVSRRLPHSSSVLFHGSRDPISIIEPINQFPSRRMENDRKSRLDRNNK